MSAVRKPATPSSLLWSAAGTITLIAAWALLSGLAGSELVLPGPISTLQALGGLMSGEGFYRAIGGSALRVALGIGVAVPIAMGIGIAAGLDSRAAAFVRPFFSLVSATPVLSVILIAFLWFGQDRTPVFAAFLMVFPVMAANVLEGVKSADHRLEEALVAYGLSRRQLLWHLYLPTLLPFLLGGLRSSLSLCWKVVVAAEVIVQPLYSLGTGMQSAKAQLETAELFAWTAATVVCAGLTELPLGWLFKRRRRREA